jgi:hypothetical protein
LVKTSPEYAVQPIDNPTISHKVTSGRYPVGNSNSLVSLAVSYDQAQQRLVSFNTITGSSLYAYQTALLALSAFCASPNNVSYLIVANIYINR